MVVVCEVSEAETGNRYNNYAIHNQNAEVRVLGSERLEKEVNESQNGQYY